MQRSLRAVLGGAVLLAAAAVLTAGPGQAQLHAAPGSPRAGAGERPQSAAGAAGSEPDQDPEQDEARGRKVRRVPLSPPSVRSDEPTPTQAESRSGCIRMDEVSGAVVSGNNAIALAFPSGEHWLMLFDSTCPFMGFYEGFYYRRRDDGQLCAGQDSIVARSGARCTIQDLVKLRRAPQKAGGPPPAAD